MGDRTIRNRWRGIACLAAVGLAASGVTAALATPAGAATSYPVVKNIGPRFTTVGGASVLPTTRTVPHWHASFVDGANGQTYGYNMVGSSPFASPATTTVNAEIIPLDIAFAADGGAGLSAGKQASWVAQSPMFQPNTYPDGQHAQYLDAVMNDEFNTIGTGYHVLLNNTGTLPASTLTVPSSKEALYQTTTGVVLGLADYHWFANQIGSLLHSDHIDPTTLPIVVTNDVFLYEGSPVNCCVIGFHGATNLATHGNGSQPVQTFAWASWTSKDIFTDNISQFSDVAPLSHEISEWGHDPFVDNYLNPWEVPGEPQYGCSNVLETGDPLVGYDYAVGSTNPDPNSGPAWHVQDEAYLWWFARQPTRAFNRAYSFFATYHSPAPVCGA